VAGGERGEGSRIRHPVPPPDDVQVGADEDQAVPLVDGFRRGRPHLQRRERRSDPVERLPEFGRGRVGARCPQEGEAPPKPVLDRGAVVEPDVRQPGARPGRRRVAEAVRVGPVAVLVRDQRRVLVPVPQLDPQQIVTPALLTIGDLGQLGAGAGACLGVLGDLRPPGGSPLPPSRRRLARGGDVACPDGPPFCLIGLEQLRAAPAVQGPGELPGEVDRVAHPCVHAEPASRDDKVSRVPGQENPSVAVPVGKHEPLRPLPDVERLVHDGHPGERLEEPRHFAVAVRHRVQGEVPGVVLHDEERGPVVGEVIVAARSDRDPGEQVRAVEQRLAQGQQRVATQLDAQLTADGAARAVAADQVRRTDRLLLPVGSAYPGRDAVLVLGEAGQLAAEPDGDARRGRRDLAQQRFERVLGDELVGLQRHGTVVDPPPRRLHCSHRRVIMMHERGAGEVPRADEDVHRHVGGQPRGAYPAGDAHPAEMLHGARVAPLHLRQAARPRTLVDQLAADPQLAQLDRQRQAHRAAADDQHVRRVHGTSALQAGKAHDVAAENHVQLLLG
jgi:hypothetical protein